MTAEFAPKDAETLKAEVLEATGLEYEGNEDAVDKIVALRQKDEEFKASLHTQKTERGAKLTKAQELLKKAGLDPETGEKLVTNVPGAGEITPKNESQLSARDIIALRDVHEEDVDYLLEEAKLRGKSVVELKKDPYTQIILKARDEERRTAAAANTGSSRKQNTKSDGEALLKKADSYQLAPDEMKTAAKATIEAVFGKK